MISLLLCLCMGFSLLPTVVLADDAEPTASTDITMQYDDYVSAETYGEVTGITDEDVLEVVDGKLYAKKVGSATFTAGGTAYTVKVEPAKLNIVLVAGQSNATGVHGNLDVPAITPAKGNSYWWDGSALIDLSEKVADQEANESTSGRSVGWYPALAAEWYALTGEKTVIIHKCVSGNPISTWASYDGKSVASQTTGTADAVKACITAIQANGNYEIAHAGYYWLQGETDAFLTNSEGIKDYTTADKYEKAYLAMHREFIKALDTAGVENSDSYGAILSCRTRNNIGGYQALEYCGMRVAQQDLANRNADIYMATVLTDEWHEARDVSFTAKSNEFGTLTYTTAAMGANNIHYNQSGYNVLGLDAADNMYDALVNKPNITSIELIGHDGYTKYQDGATIKVEENMRIIDENNVEEDTGKAQIVARTLPISAASSSSGVTMTLTNASGSPVSGVMDSRGWIDTTKMSDKELKLTVEAGGITKTYTLSKESGGTNPDPDPEEPADSFYYNWDFTDDTQYGVNNEGKVTLASKADENTLTYTQDTATHNAAAGLSNKSGQYFSMEKAVRLSDKAKWTIEWRGVQETGNNGLLLSNNDSDFSAGGRTTPYLYLRNGGDGGAYDVSYCYKGMLGAEGNKLFNLKETEHENDLSSAAWSLSCDGNGNLTLTNDKNYSQTVTINGPVTYNGVLGRFGSNSPLCYFGTIEYLKIYSADRAADSFYYNWDFTDDTQYDKNAEGMVTLASKADENTLTYTQKTATHNAAAGLSNNSGEYFSMEKDVTLSDKAKWTIEWRGVQKTNSNGLLLSNNDSDYSADGRTTPYLYLRNGADHGAYDVSYCYEGTFGAEGNKLFNLTGTEHENDLSSAAWSLSCDGNGNLTLTNDKNYSQTVTINGPVTYNGVLGRFGSNSPLCYFGTIEYLKIYSADRAADSFYYNWDFTDNEQYNANTDGKVTLASKADKNTLTYTEDTATYTATAGLSNDNGQYFSMEKDVTLSDTAKWTIEWRGVQETGNNGLLLSNNNSDYGVDGRTTPYLYLRNGGDHGAYDVSYCYGGIVGATGNQQFNLKGTAFEENLATAAWSLSCDGNKTLTLTNDKGYLQTVTIDGPVTYNGVLGRFGSRLTLCYSGTIEYLKIYSADRAAEAATQHDYYWDFTKAANGTLEAETSDRWSKNTLSFKGDMGEVTADGLKNSISNGYFDMETAVVLPQDEPWTIEWKGRTTAQSVLLANNNETTDQSTPRKGGEYIYIFNDHRLDNPNDNGISLRINNTNPAATFNGIPTEIRESTNTVWYLIHDGNGNLKLAANVNGRTFVMEAANKITQDYTFNGVLGYFTKDAPFDFDGTIQYLKIYHSAADITAPADAELTMDTSKVPRTGYQAGDGLDLEKLVVKYGGQELTKHGYGVVCTPAVLGEGKNIVNVEVRYMGKSVTEQLTVYTSINPFEITGTTLDSAKPYFLGDTVTVTVKCGDADADVNVISTSPAFTKDDGETTKTTDADGNVVYTFTFKVTEINGSGATVAFKAEAANAQTEAKGTAETDGIYVNLRNRIHLKLKNADGTEIKDATVIRRNNYWSDTYQPTPDEMTYIEADSEYRCHDWAVANDDNGTIIITLKDGRTATLTTDKNGRDIRTLLHTGTEEIYCEYTFPAYKVTGKLFFNGEPVLYDGHNQKTKTVFGKFGTPIPYSDLEAWAEDYVQNTLDKDNNPTTVDVEIKKDGGTVETDETAFGEAGKLHNYVYVNAKTSYTVTFMNGETQVAQEEVLYGTATPVPAENPTREGYEFLGWAEVVGDELKPVTDTVTRTVTYQAQWKLNTYIIASTLRINGNEAVKETGKTYSWSHRYGGDFGVTIDYTDMFKTLKEKALEVDAANEPCDAEIELRFPGDKNRDGKLFNETILTYGQAGGGWNPGVKNTAYIWGYATTSYEVIFNSDGGSTVDTKIVKYGEKAAKPEDPTMKGYNFLGWFDKDGNPFDFNTEITHKTELKAKWEKKDYIIASNLRVNNGEPVKDEGKTYSWTHRYGGKYEETIDYQPMFDALKARALEADKANEPNPTKVDVELHFPNSSNLFNEAIQTYGQDGGGWNPGVKNTAYIWGYAWTYYDVTFVTPEGATTVDAKLIRNGEKAEKPDEPTKEGWKFLGWYADAAFKTKFDFNAPITKKTSVYAKFELVSTPIGDTYVRYDVLHIKQLPDGSYDLANAEVEHLSAKKDTTVTAVIKDYRATHHINVNRTLSKLTDTAIQAHPGADGKPVYTILTVYYDLDFHTLTFDAKGGTETGSIIVRHGNTVAKPEDPKRSGYRFNGWFDDEKCREKHDFDAPLVEDATVYAGWTKRSSGSSVQIESPNKPKKDDSLKFNTEDHFAYVNGYPDGTVKPTGDVTRAEVAAILYRVMDADCVKTYETTRCSFSDVVRGDWFNLYVATLENADVIVDTRTNGKFRPNEAITRAELAAMLAQFADIKSAANSFNDVSARHWASDEIAVCAKMGWINGYPDGSFRPDATITRAEMMAMINRALGRTPKSADDLLSGMKTWRDNANVNAWYYLDVQEATNSHTYTKSGTHETWKKLR